MLEHRQRIDLFRKLHHSEDILVLPNAWDAASARILAAAGAAGIGTTSMGISASLGYPDVQQIPLDRMVERIGEIVAAVAAPVSADMESGYGATPTEVAAAIDRAIDCGIAGINIEDGTGDPAAPLLDAGVLAERIAAIRDRAAARGLPIVINARTDTYLTDWGANDTVRLRETVRRGQLYVSAGADCIFVPGGLDGSVIATLVEELDAPLNLVANPALSTPVVAAVAELQRLGVARVSTGSGIHRATLALTQTIAEELLGNGHYDTMSRVLAAPGSAAAYARAIGQPTAAKPRRKTKAKPITREPTQAMGVAGSRVILFTDGACRGNPGPGGWAYILKHPDSGQVKEAAGGAPLTTNNQMELQAVIEGLKALTARCVVEIVTDSEYVAKGSREWMPKWKANDWKRREGGKLKPVKNEPLWRELDGLLARHETRFSVVRGHSGHPENERCDELAVEAAMQQFR